MTFGQAPGAALFEYGECHRHTAPPTPGPGKTLDAAGAGAEQRMAGAGARARRKKYSLSASLKHYAHAGPDSMQITKQAISEPMHRSN